MKFKNQPKKLFQIVSFRIIKEMNFPPLHCVFVIYLFRVNALNI